MSSTGSVTVDAAAMRATSSLCQCVLFHVAPAETGFMPATFLPRAAKACSSAAVTSDLPTSVSVPVTNQALILAPFPQPARPWIDARLPPACGWRKAPHADAPYPQAPWADVLPAPTVRLRRARDSRPRRRCCCLSSPAGLPYLKTKETSVKEAACCGKR